MRRFAQHFLSNRHAVDRIVEALHLSKQDSVLEIGPGKGVLTGQLVAKAGRVTAVEVDDPLIPYLTKKFSTAGNFELIHSDILEFNVGSIPVPIKIVGNLPYNLTSPILRQICNAKNWTEAILMVQKEVGDRLVAESGTAAYGALTVGVRLYAEVARVFDLSENSFDPPPRVKSTVVRLTRRSKPLSEDPKSVQNVVQAAFQQRRKTVLNSLSHGLGLTKQQTETILRENRIDSNSRAEVLSVDTYVKLAQFLEKIVRPA